MSKNNFTAESVISNLKDFQINTVEHVFNRFFTDKDQTRRFLVADEVGLGKTMVAKGVIAKTIEHLQSVEKRFDIVYICSNAAIGAQNVNRLQVLGDNAIPTRLTLLVDQLSTLRKSSVNFISFTPGTGLDFSGSRMGIQREREIIYWMLSDLKILKRKFKGTTLLNGLCNLLQGRVGRENWLKDINKSSCVQFDKSITNKFLKEVRSDKALKDDLIKVCKRFARKRNWQKEDNQESIKLIGKLRYALAQASINVLKPKLVILDEFQRFKTLLNKGTENDDSSKIAKEFFGCPGARLLLLSATPYKMYTIDSELDDDNHYNDFFQTLEFLYEDSNKVSKVRGLLHKYRTILKSLENQSKSGINVKTELEKLLGKVISRTERLAITRNEDSVLIKPKILCELKSIDLTIAKDLDLVARNLFVRDQIEYWKSTPYPINFMRDYVLRRKLNMQLRNPSNELKSALNEIIGNQLTEGKIEDYESIELANSRLRSLCEHSIDNESWKLLWMPPSMPYTKPNGVYTDKGDLTKTLIFSRWTAVPNAIATICSYEVEWRIMSGSRVKYSRLSKDFSPKLRFDQKNKNPTGMNILSWVLPSPTVARKIDPLEIAMRNNGKQISVQNLRLKVKAKLRELLKKLPKGKPSAREDQKMVLGNFLLVR